MKSIKNNNTELSNTQLNVSQTDKQNYRFNEMIKGTPFTIIKEEEGDFFGVMGKFQITEHYENYEDLKEELQKITWDRLIQVIAILTDLKPKQDEA